MISSFVPGFRPSIHGLHFPNSFPENAPVIKVDLPLLGKVGFGDASGGLCGGMVFAVRDFFEAGLAPPGGGQPPAPESPLFEFLGRRLIDSFNLPEGVARYFHWMNLPDENRGPIHGLASKTVGEEWPAIQTEIDQGRLAPLGVLTVHSVNPVQLGECHQILAYRYDLDESSGDLTIHVYDPNQPDRDDMVLGLNIAPSGQPTRISYNGGIPVRGFFLTSYQFANPAGALS